MKKLGILIVAMLLVSVSVNAQDYTKSKVEEIANGFISTLLMEKDLKGTLAFFDPSYVAEQHDNFLEGRTEQFVTEFLSGTVKKGYYDMTPELHRIKSMKVKKVCCNPKKEEFYADVQILMDYGVKYTVRLDLHVTESGELRFIGAVG
ncbi:MAG: hypothetical protein IJV33_09790 [Bacteroidaceae bacterium]|nr:hypothetical protein [Bacteroidaceae bacterium]